MNKAMGAYYWIKLWLEMLDDAKIGTLPDWAFRRWIEFLLVAREYDRGGLLPPVRVLAWRIRLSEQRVAEALRALAQIGVARETPDGWLIVNFTKRQAAVSGSERVKQFRNREKAAERGGVMKRYGHEHGTKRFVSQNAPVLKRQDAGTEVDTETEADAERERAAEAQVEIPPGSSQTMPWPEIPDAMTAERVFQELTAMVTFPGRTREDDIRRICAIYDAHKSGTVAYLRPYWQAWNARGYNRVNTGWLDWAVSGQIPNPRNAKTPPQPPEEAIGCDDPTVLSAYKYLKLNPRGLDRQGAIEDLAAKGYRYDDGRLVKIEPPA